jgi:hypothetical protein
MGLLRADHGNRSLPLLSADAGQASGQRAAETRGAPDMKVHQPGEGRKTEGSNSMPGKNPIDQDAPFQLYCAESEVHSSERGSKNAIEHLRTVLGLPDLDAGDAPAFRRVILTLEGIVASLTSVKAELGKTELSKIPMKDDIPR